MNYSYVMGINNVDELKDKGFVIETYGKNYGVSFKDDLVPLYEDFISKNLRKGFWNEYLGKDKVFIFKDMNNNVEKYILNDNNEEKVLELCKKYAECDFTSIDSMLKGNAFYAKKVYGISE